MYIPLYVKTNYSLLSSLISIDKLIEYASKNHISSLAITDSNMFGAMEFYKKCKKNQIKPILGLEVEVEDSVLLLYAKNYNGYLTLIKLSTIQATRKVTISDILHYHNEVIGILPFSYKEKFSLFSEYFKDFYLGYQDKEEEKVASSLTEKIVFLRKNLYFLESDSEYLRYLYMIRDGKTISDDTHYDIKNYHLMINDIYEYTTNEHLHNTTIIADMCDLEFPKTNVLLPIYQDTNGLDSHSYLKELASYGLKRRLGSNLTKNYIDRLYYELNIIEKMGFSNYFLVVYDFIRYAKKNKILVGPGRGSGAGSLVCFSLGITDIDPLKYDLLFERFLNPERVTMPDIDTDFPDIYRDKVIDYVVSKYGEKRVCGIVTFGTLASKQALRDVGRILNIPSYQIDMITKRIPTVTKLKLIDFYQQDNEFKKMINSDNRLKKLYQISSFLEGFPRHTSIHAAGIVMSKKDLDEVIPLTVSDGMYLTGFPMEYLEELGLLKMDFLGLKTLTTIMNIIADIEKSEHITIDFNKIPLDDTKVLSLFATANTTGIFQFESVGMKNFLRKLKPSTFEDIFAAIALFRPGPAQNIDSYIKRKHHEEEITYLDPSLEPILKSTYGIIIYQEQIMQIANKFASYTLGEADILRRAMSKKKMEVLKGEEEHFISNSMKNGHSKEISKQIFDLILSFANYGFNRSHSVAYSVIAYKMAYLKYYFPKYFYSNLLSSVIGSDSKTNDYMMEAKLLNISILKPSINHSSCSYVVKEEGIYYPLSGIRNIGSTICNEIVDKRENGYTDIFDFLARVNGINRKVLESLIQAGCFDEFGITRKTYIENLESIINYSDLAHDLNPEFVLKPELIKEEEYSNTELIAMEKELFGVYLSNHPVTFYKAKFNQIVSLNQVGDYFDKIVNFVVLVEKVKKIITKRGEEMMFFDGSDEYGMIDFTLFPKVFMKYSDIKIGDILKITGRVERRYDSFQIVVSKLEKLN